MYEHVRTLVNHVPWSWLSEKGQTGYQHAYHFAHSEGRQAERVERREKVREVLAVVHAARDGALGNSIAVRDCDYIADKLSEILQDD
jgi:hypothetical protein